MTDIDRDDTKLQPTTIPVIGTPSGVYDAPGEDWDAAPVRVPLDDAAEEAGFAPDQDFEADRANDIWGRLGQGLASIVDYAAINPTDREDSAAPDFNGVGNAHFGTALAPAHLMGDYNRDALVTVNSGGLWYSYNGRTWTGPSDLGFVGPPQQNAIAAGVRADGTTVTVLVFGAESGEAEEFQFRASNNLGGSWADAGQLPAVEEVIAPILGVHDGRWFYIDRGKVYYSDDLTDTEWTGGLVAFGAAADPRKFVSTPTECAFAISAGHRVLRSSDGGDTWTAANTGLASGGIQDLIWSPSHALFFAAHTNGQIYSAPAGMAAWTSRIATGGSVVRLAALGRALFFSVDDQVRVSRDLEHHTTLEPLANGSGDETEWRRMFVLNGRVWVGQIGATHRHTSFMSGVLPSELNAMLGAW